MIPSVRCLLVGVCMAGFLTACNQATPPLPGTLYFSQDQNPNGLFEIDMETGAATLVGAGNSGFASGTVGLAGRGADDDLIGSTMDELAYVKRNGASATTFSAVKAAGLAYSSVTDLVYATYSGNLVAVSPSTGEVVETLAPVGAILEGLAADDGAGLLYGLGYTTGMLYVYDIATDVWSTVFDTEKFWDYAGLAYDPVEGVLYAIGDLASSQTVYRIDVGAQTVTAVGPIGVSGVARGGLGWVPAQ